MSVRPAPKHRSPLRLFLGKRWFRTRRYARWIREGRQYATTLSPQTVLPELVFQHQSLILRPLAGVDMRLQENKKTNLRLAVERLNGLVIDPEKVFSFWYLVGKPSQRRGFLPGLILQNGTVQKGVGGGLCQLGNLLFWIILHSPLTVTERWRHSYDVFPDVKRKVPFGAGATLSYNYVDLQFKNQTKQPFQLKLWLSETHLHGQLFTTSPLEESYTVEERNHQIRGQAWGGYTRHNQIIRIRWENATERKKAEELVTENHAILMYQPFLGAPDGEIRSADENSSKE
ncbi:MAG: VanW family protein [Bacteroidota bacterium]